ncbi:MULTISPECIES: baseplate J/gp47 family protein [unclassified Pseudovibrio]|uniref:baseplate J/gp47 family protein n=1 Tax=unclassified Pseudovibrio TaxID=2627060 RepID=UPI0007AE4EF8|nr:MULTISPECIES: baseplate J/gp47 family protein [unclassified Pseudovibrio]KZK97272.1 Baseplate J-like protein [Pseudovibrio sp. W74]KZL08958.1 Baseplate J-like protein [Pseudovibrio sp. Ad14]
MVNLIKTLTTDELIRRGPPQHFTTSAKAWKEKLVAWWETHPDGPQRKLYPAHYEMLLINLLSYGLSLLGKEGQDAADKRWLLFAKGHSLDVAAANNGTFRLKSKPARVELAFTLETPRGTDLILPRGLEISAGEVSFALDDQQVLKAGKVALSGRATATQPGPEANGLLPGQITQISAGYPDVSVTNTTTSAGGTTAEDDSSLLYRAAKAHDRISKAGPKESYRQQARAFSPDIADVEVIRPEPGRIALYVLLTSGVPGVQFCADLKAYLDPQSKRPQGDELSVHPAELVRIHITGPLKVNGDFEAAHAASEEAIRKAGLIWSQRLGDYLALSALTPAVRLIEGVVDVDLHVSNLASRQLGKTQFAVIGDVDLVAEAS